MRYLCHKIDTVDKKLFLRKAKEKDRDTFFYLFYKSGLENKNDLDSQELYKIYEQILYLIFNYPHKHYTFKHFEV